MRSVERHKQFIPYYLLCILRIGLSLHMSYYKFIRFFTNQKKKVSFYASYPHRYFRSQLACHFWPWQNGWVFFDLGVRSVGKLESKVHN